MQRALYDRPWGFLYSNLTTSIKNGPPFNWFENFDFLTIFNETGYVVIHEHLVAYPANCHNRSVYCSNVCSLVFYHSVWTVVVFVYLHRSYTQRCLWSSVMRVEFTSHYKDKLCILMFAFFLCVSTTTRQWNNALFVIFDKRTFWLKMLCKQLCTEKDWRYQNDKR